MTTLTRPEAILFDMGGVLSDACDTYDAENYPLSFPEGLPEGVPLDWFLGMSAACTAAFIPLPPPRPAIDLTPIVKEWLAKRSILPEPAAVARWLRVLEQWEARPIYPHVFPALENLREQGYRLGVVSNTLSAAHYLREHFERAGILQLFEVVVFSAEFGRNKPDPAIFEHALATLGVAPEEAWFVGDKPQRDICGAHRAGMTAVLVDSAHTGHTKDGPDHVPDYRVKDIGALPALLKGLAFCP